MLRRRAKSLAKAIVPNRYHAGISAAKSSVQRYISDYGIRSYSQQGEDTILRILFDGIENGFYVDVGAHHPKQYSNTYYFYKRGWRGMNIDAMPGSMEKFKKSRPRDINLEMGVSRAGGPLEYFAFNEPGLSGFSKENSNNVSADHSRYVIFAKVIDTLPLREILDRYLPEGQTIDFLSVDVEGLDAEVLESNDWHKYAPDVVLTEALDLWRLEDVHQSSVYELLKKQGYFLFSKCFHTLIFVREDSQIGGR